MLKILVVDDEPNIIELARLYLERDDYKVEAAMNGQDTLSTQKALNPDLIILDLMLPDIDGFEVCRQLRTKSAVPVLMLTARKEDVDKECLLNLSYHEHLWQEREIKTVSNITRHDIREFLPLAAEIAIRPKVTSYRLEEANRALMDLKRGGVKGAKVLVLE